MSADESNVSKSTFSDGATFDVGTALEDGAFDLDNGPFFEDGTAFDDVLLIDDFALEDGTFDFDDAPFFEDGATFFDALFNDDFVLEDGMFNFDDCPTEISKSNEESTFDDAVFNDDATLEDGDLDEPALDVAVFLVLEGKEAAVEAPAVAPATAVTPLGTSGSQLWHTKSSSLKCNTGSQMTRPHMKCINCLHSAQR
jgi:hypothetical protein